MVQFVTWSPALGEDSSAGAAQLPPQTPIKRLNGKPACVCASRTPMSDH